MSLHDIITYKNEPPGRAPPTQLGDHLMGFIMGQLLHDGDFYPVGERKACLEIGEKTVMIWATQMLRSGRKSE